MDDAADLTAVLGADGHDVATIAQGNDGILQNLLVVELRMMLSSLVRMESSVWRICGADRGGSHWQCRPSPREK